MFKELLSRVGFDCVLQRTHIHLHAKGFKNHLSLVDGGGCLSDSLVVIKEVLNAVINRLFSLLGVVSNLVETFDNFLSRGQRTIFKSPVLGNPLVDGTSVFGSAVGVGILALLNPALACALNFVAFAISVRAILLTVVLASFFMIRVVGVVLVVHILIVMTIIVGIILGVVVSVVVGLVVVFVVGLIMRVIVGAVVSRVVPTLIVLAVLVVVLVIINVRFVIVVIDRRSSIEESSFVEIEFLTTSVEDFKVDGVIDVTSVFHITSVETLLERALIQSCAVKFAVHAVAFEG